MLLPDSNRRRLCAAALCTTLLYASLSAQEERAAEEIQPAAPGKQADVHLEMGKMWTFENPPLAYLEKEYGFKPNEKWLNSLRLASLRFGQGCSASFVSPQGLIMTNHHCVRDNIASVQGEHNWIRDSFVAKSLDDEVKLPRLTVQQLIASRDVTAEINRGVSAGASDEAVSGKRKANEKALLVAARKEHPDLTPQVITMHNGATYQLYLYRIFDDVRLVCSPHLQTSHFGGDPDNFTYPRYGIDFTFCRAYVDGKPADTSKYYFRWSTSGPKKGELAFVTGNPGSTGRLNTCGQMNYLRDARYPILLQRFDDELPIVKAQAAVDAAYDKRTKAQVLRMENSQKAVRGYLNSLLDASLTEAKGRAEALFKGKIAADPKLWAEYGSAWAELEKINHEKTSLEPKRSFYAASPYSQEMRRAAALVAATDEARSEKQRAAAAKQVKIQLTASPVRQKLFAASLRRAKQWLGDDDPVIQLLIGNRTIEEAIEQIQKSVVADAGEVDKLLDGGRKALESSGDAVIRAALLVDQQAKIVGARMAELNTRESVQATRIGRALYAAYGNSVSPDATFSLRFSDGLVKGFPCNGTLAPYRTTFYGLYARNVEFDNVHPFDLPEIWLARKNKIDMHKGVCFVATNDIIGGNSGSPIVNTDLEVIGLIFDGNIEMLGNRFLYRDDVPRSVSVHSDAILEACSKIYEAQRIVDEIRTGSK